MYVFNYYYCSFVRLCVSCYLCSRSNESDSSAKPLALYALPFIASFRCEQKSSCSTSKPGLPEFKGFGGIQSMPCPMKPFRAQPRQPNSLPHGRRQPRSIFFLIPVSTIWHITKYEVMFPVHRWSIISQGCKTHMRPPGSWSRTTFVVAFFAVSRSSLPLYPFSAFKSTTAPF